MHDAKQQASPRVLAFGALLLVFFGCLVGRAILVSLFGIDTPFFDQWDAEADHLLRPWLEGSLTWQGFFQPLNEHRVIFTHLTTIVLFELNNRQWDNLVESYAEAVISAATFTFLYAGLCRSGTPAYLRWTLGLMAVLLCALPFCYENTLVGFQSQFYFMTCAAMSLVAAAVFLKPTIRTAAVIGIIAIASLFTMAGGAIAPLVVVAAIALRSWRTPIPSNYVLLVGALMTIAFGCGLYIMPAVELQKQFAAVGLRDFLDAFLAAMMWPLQAWPHPAWPLATRVVIVLAIWSPTIAWLLRYLKSRSASPSELFAASISIWVTCQALAFAHARGHLIQTAIASRYRDLFAVALIVNVFFLAQLVQRDKLGQTRRSLVVAGAVSYAAMITVALALRTPTDWQFTREHAFFTRIQTSNTARFMQTNDPQWLVKPSFQTPYFNAKRLQYFLLEPTIRDSLPPSLRIPLGKESDITMTDSGEYIGPSVESRFPYLRFGQYNTAHLTPGMTLDVVDSHGNRQAVDLELLGTTPNRSSYVPTPRGVFHIELKGGRREDWLAVGTPVEYGLLSCFSRRIQETVRAAAQRLTF